MSHIKVNKVKCLICNWTSPETTNFEVAEMQLFEHVEKVHGVKIAAAINQETGETVKFNHTENKE